VSVSITERYAFGAASSSLDDRSVSIVAGARPSRAHSRTAARDWIRLPSACLPIFCRSTAQCCYIDSQSRRALLRLADLDHVLSSRSPSRRALIRLLRADTPHPKHPKLKHSTLPHAHATSKTRYCIATMGRARVLPCARQRSLWLPKQGLTVDWADEAGCTARRHGETVG